MPANTWWAEAQASTTSAARPAGERKASISEANSASLRSERWSAGTVKGSAHASTMPEIRWPIDATAPTGN